MDEVGVLIGRFEDEDTDSLPEIDTSKKVDIVRRLENLTDERVLPFFMRVLASQQEYDLARIEILRILEVRRARDAHEGELIGKLIQRMLSSDPDDDVRNYAAMAISSYMDVKGSLEVVEGIIFNVEEEINLRWNAFTAVERMGPTREGELMLHRLLKDDQFKGSAQRVLSQWDSKEKSVN